MSMEAITLEVDSEAARAFKSASVEDRKKLALITTPSYRCFCFLVFF